MPIPPVDYTSRDYAAFVQNMEDAISVRVPEWTNRSAGDFGITLIELFAYVADILSYYGDRIANESFLATAVQRSSVMRLAALIDYTPHGSVGAKTTVTFKNDSTVSVTIPALTQVTTKASLGDAVVVFETDADVTVASGGATNTVSATQGTTTPDEPIGTSDGSYDQRRTLFNSPVIDGSVRVNVDEGLGPRPWTFFGHLTDAAATDPAFTTETDENGIVTVVFGDGVNGRIPQSGSTITATYRVGGGTIGNVGAYALQVIIGSFPGVSVYNTDPAYGGSEPETIEHIRAQAPKSLTAQGRAVTLADYAALALKVSGVAKASAQADVYTSVRLYVNPNSGFLASGVGGALDTAVASLANALTNATGNGYLDDKKMINTTVVVLPSQYAGAPGYTPIKVTAAITVKNQYGQTAVANEVNNALQNVLAFENVDFGQRVTLSSMYHAMNAVDGVDYGVITVLKVDNGGADSVGDVVVATNSIPKMGTLLVTASGGLT